MLAGRREEPAARVEHPQAEYRSGRDQGPRNFAPRVWECGSGPRWPEARRPPRDGERRQESDGVGEEQARILTSRHANSSEMHWQRSNEKELGHRLRQRPLLSLLPSYVF